MSYDIVYRFVQIDLAAFPLRHRNLRQLLVDFGLFHRHPDYIIKKFIINPKYKKLFDTELIPEIKNRKMGLDQLKKLIEQNQVNGLVGERFALQFERARLPTHPNPGSIEIISEYDVGAGYDLVSYETSSAVVHDRFIEVKSFSGTPTFHWSRNEIEVARIKKGQYYLYLVDRDKILRSDYEPLIIRNPYEEIIERASSVWKKRVEDYFVTQIN